MCGGCDCGCGGETVPEERTRAVQSPCCQSGPAGAPQPNPCAGVYRRRSQSPPPPQRNPCVGDYERHMYETQDEDICDWGPKQPYQIPGYAGHVPTLQNRSGDTYGQETHRVLVSTRTPTAQGKTGHICPAPLHEPYRLPGYTGHVPGLQHMVGGTYGQDTHRLLYSVQPYPGRQENHSPYCPTRVTSNFRNEADQPGTQRTQPAPGHSNMDTSYINHSEEPRNTDKSVRDASEYPAPGQLAHDIPYGYGKYGDHHECFTNSALYDFTSNYRRRLSSEWAPATTSRPDPPTFDPPGEIYSQHTGLLPGYTAHVPGAMFRCGRTFTEDSRDARRALRGDRF